MKSTQKSIHFPTSVPTVKRFSLKESSENIQLYAQLPFTGSECLFFLQTRHIYKENYNTIHLLPESSRRKGGEKTIVWMTLSLLRWSLSFPLNLKVIRKRQRADGINMATTPHNFLDRKCNISKQSWPNKSSESSTRHLNLRKHTVRSC